MSTISWLHLSDLHLNLGKQKWLWPTVQEKFYKDLGILHEKTGPWDLVLFSGDLSYSGSKEEFNRLDDLLGDLWKYFEQMGSKPKLLCVPGNHDLSRPDPNSATVKALSLWHTDKDVREVFWENDNNEYRSTVDVAFHNYTEWWKNIRLPKVVDTYKEGLLPGDFSAIITKDDIQLGIVGLNSAFLQLTGNDYHGKLELDLRQLHYLCNDDPPGWCKSNHLNLLMTHHPPHWLANSTLSQFTSEIATSGRFFAHIFGHMHELKIELVRKGGAPIDRKWQVRSLFGLEKFGDKQERSHGYTSARIDLSSKEDSISLWPRIMEKSYAGNWIMIPDYRSELNQDNSISETIQISKPIKTEPPSQKPITTDDTDPTIKYFVDRKLQKELFDILLRGWEELRIMTVHAESGMGKTTLIKYLQHECNIKKIPSTLFTFFNSKADTYVEIMCSIRDTLGPKDFNSFTDLINSYDSQLNSGYSSEESLKNIRMQLTDEFISCLKLLVNELPSDKCLVCFFDAFENADSREWLCNEFLSKVGKARLRRVTMVIAGQKVPELSKVPCPVLLKYNLPPLTQDDTRTYLDKMGIPLDEDRIRHLHRNSGGKPVDICTWVSMIGPNGG